MRPTIPTLAVSTVILLSVCSMAYAVDAKNSQAGKHTNNTEPGEAKSPAKKADNAIPIYHIVKNKSFLKFFAIQNGAPVEGKFSDFSGVAHFDPEALSQSYIEVEVNTGSVAMANSEVQETLKQSGWLAVEAFPKATYKTTKISKFPNSESYYADGELSLAGKKVAVPLNFLIEHKEANQVLASGYVTLKRSDFGIGKGEWAKTDAVKNEVRVEFRVIAERN